jgi:ferredoxin
MTAKGAPVKIAASRELCKGHGQCELFAPDVFEVDDDALVTLKVSEIGPDQEVSAEARDGLGDNAMRIGDYLRVPYIVTAQSQPRPDGSWVRHVEHPELPGCIAEAESITEALDRLDQRRVHVVLGMLAKGRIPPTRRTLLGDAQARRRAQRAGLGDQLADVWELDATQVSPDKLAQAGLRHGE